MKIVNKISVKKYKNIVVLKRCLLLTALLFSFNFVSTVHAQKSVEEYEYKGGEFEINAGIGLMSTYVSQNAGTRIPPLSMILNYRVKKHLSLGAYFGYSSTEYKTEEQTKGLPAEDLFLRNDFYLVGLRLQGHYNSGRADFYGGAMLGYNFSKINTNIDDPSQRPEGINIEEGSLVTYSGFIGLKYLASPNIGLFGEIGYGASLINVGASYRF